MKSVQNETPAPAQISNLSELKRTVMAKRTEILIGLGLANSTNGAEEMQNESEDAYLSYSKSSRKRSRTTRIPKQESLTSSSQAHRRSPRMIAQELDVATVENSDENPQPSQVVVRPLVAPTPPQPGQLRTLDARLDYMNQHYLGKHVPVSLAGAGNQAKAAVIWETCNARPPFNKYNGCAEFRNAMLLFINVTPPDGGAASQYSNTFLDGGRRVTWYASASKHPNSNDVLRLANHQTGYKSAEFSLAPARVALVCRLPGEPYVWCGELLLDEFDAGNKPLAFEFRLKHFDELQSSNAPAFNSLLRVALGDEYFE